MSSLFSKLNGIIVQCIILFRPTIKPIVINSNNQGINEKINDLDKIGFPVFRKASINPVKPINPPPIPTKENNGLSAPVILSQRGKIKIINPAMPWIVARIIVAKAGLK